MPAAARSRGTPPPGRWLEDHDLLIKIDTKLEALTNKVDEIGKDKANAADLAEVKTKVEAQDRRLKIVERLCYIAVGAIMLLELLVKVWPLLR